MDLLSYDSRRYFVFWIRIFFGLWLLYAGLYKWIGMGPNVLVSYITSEFDKTWSPHALNVFLAWVILFAEPLLSLWILSGIRAAFSMDTHINIYVSACCRPNVAHETGCNL